MGIVEVTSRGVMAIKGISCALSSHALPRMLGGSTSTAVRIRQARKQDANTQEDGRIRLSFVYRYITVRRRIDQSHSRRTAGQT